MYIDISSLQISLLGGRVFFTGLRYHGANETILVQHGFITWQYWLRRVRDADIGVRGNGSEAGASDTDKNASLPCRINVNLIGLEWFVYNRSPAYDSILAGLTEERPGYSPSTETPDEKDEDGLRPRKTRPRSSSENAFSTEKEGRNGNANPENTTEDPGVRLRKMTWTNTQGGSVADGSDTKEDEPELPFLLRLFPIRIDCERAAAVIGNDNTKAILIVKSDSIATDVDVSATDTPDPYRQTFKIMFQHPVVEMRENEDYKEDQVAQATREREVAQEPVAVSKTTFFRHQRRRFVSSLRNMVPYWRRSVESFSSESRQDLGTATSQMPASAQWQGLSRYLDDRHQDDKTRWSSIEYAAESSVLDCPTATLTVYWDVVAKVSAYPRHRSDDSAYSKINGDKPPAWGMHISIGGGTMHYGPWADRQRADLQRVFFPTLSKDASPAKPLPAGAWRMPTQFELLVEIDDAVTVRVPMKEESKNWRWRGKEPQMKHPEAPNKRRQRNRPRKGSKGETTQLRPAGWLEVKVPANSTVTYSMDMLASSTGYKNLLKINLPSTELWSSVNHDVLWRSGPQKLACDLSNPLGWNALRNWHFNVDCEDLDLYLLRDHMFLLIDLVDDWASGPPPEYLVFTPFKYHLNLSFRNLRLYLNVNDGNIIDKATALDDNAYLVFSSPLLAGETTIPIDTFRPHKNVIPFHARADTIDLSLNVPQWNTQAAFLSSGELGHADGLIADGSYHYNTSVSPTNTDTLLLDIHGQSPYTYLYGFVVRYFILMKDNYFGDYAHFRTLEEYQEGLKAGAGIEVVARPPPKKSNDLDVILNFKVDDPKAMLPTNLYSADRYVQCELASLAVDLRFTNYFMEMELDLSPLNLSLGNKTNDLDSPNMASSNTQLFIDGLRVFGHRTFGLPPTESTYLCNWDVTVGAVTGECTSDFITALAKVGAAFAFQFDDVENALVPYSSLVFHDITFVRLAVISVRLWLHIEEAAFLLTTDAIEVKSNDWARSHYSKRANVHIPNVQLSCINAENAARHSSRKSHPIETDAFLKTDIRLATISRKYHFSEERKLQQEMVRREDQRTLRTPFFVFPELLEEFVLEPVEPPAQCFPSVPEPVYEVDDDEWPSLDATQSRRSNHSSGRSFLSSRQSGGSLRRPRRHLTRQSNVKQGGDASRSLSVLADERPLLGRRTPSGSTGRHSRLQIPSADFVTRESLHHSSVAFSSQYFAPHFHLEEVQPDTREATFESGEDDVRIEGDSDDEIFNGTTISLEDIDPDRLSEEYAYSSIVLEFPSGVNAFVRPAAFRHVSSLLSALQPSEPEDILDFLQIGAMTDIFDFKKQANVNGKIKDVLVRLPKASVRFLNSSTLDSPDPSQEEQDQYDLQVSRVALATRTTIDLDGTVKNERKAPRTSLHFRVGSAEVSASERLSSLEEPQAAMMIQIQRIMVSVGSKEVQYFDADVRSVIGSSASGKIEYLASLVHRTGALASELGQLLAKTSSGHQERLRFCTYRLLEVGRGTNDPSFLIRPSAVLRSANEHLRTFDSWKLIMHLRQIFVTIGPVAKSKVAHECGNWNSVLAVPPNVAQLALAGFQYWRGWDMDDPRDSVLFKNIFGRTKDQKIADGDLRPLLGACKLAELQFVLDPGPKENKIALSDVTARAHQATSRPQDPLGTVEDVKGPLTVLSLSCDEASANLDWELCELIDDILQLYNRNPPPERHSPIPAKTTSQGAPPAQTAFQVILDLNRVSIDLDTINLKAQTLNDGMKASILMCGRDNGVRFTSVMLNCGAVTTMVYSHSQPLSVFQLREPSVIMSHELQETAETSLHTIKAMASSQGLTFALKQDAIVLMELLDRLLRDEVAQLYRFQSHVPASAKPKEPIKISDRLSSFRLDVAMFLDGYKIVVPLVQSLTYTISGVVARAACAANFGKELIFDFDIKENAHEMLIDVRGRPQSICLIEMPPTNGRITSRMQSSEHVLTVLSSLEVVRLDASAVYNLLSALNRPQISSAMEEIQQQSKLIQDHASEIFENRQPSSSQAPAKSASEMVYNVHLTFAGLQLLANTPRGSNLEPIAQMLFSLDNICLQASNRHEAQGPILKYPDLYLNLKKIGLDVSRGTQEDMRSYGSLDACVTISASSTRGEDGKEDWSFHFRNDMLDVVLSPETISTVMDVLGYMGEKIKDLDTSRELDYLRKLRQSQPRITINDQEEPYEMDILDSMLASMMYRFELRNIRACWIVADPEDYSSDKEDMVLSISLIEFGTRSKKSARLTIEDFMLQTVPPGHDKSVRSLHSALLPEVVFNIAYASTADARRMAFQVVGESLDLRLTSGFIVPAANLVESISLSMENVRLASAQWNTGGAQPSSPGDVSSPAAPKTLFGNKRMDRLLIDADFAGAVVYVSSKRRAKDSSFSKYGRPSLAGKYGQFNTDDTGSGAVLRSPGLAWKIEYRDDGGEDSLLFGEIKIDASNNILYPSVVPLIMDIVSSVKEVVANDKDQGTVPKTETDQTLKRQKPGDEDNILTADPSAVLGRMKLNLGLRINRQEFTLSCQPIARVAATTSFDYIYFTVNTVTSHDHGNFFAISGTFSKPQASVQHVYSRESTGSLKVDSVTLSFMNSKHVSGTSGVSAILNVSPMEISINAKQLQDFLLFREIWYPKDLREVNSAPMAKLETELSQGHLVQRYQQVAATAAFPWTATISVSALDVNVDMGQAIGRTVFKISDFWVSSKKTSDWEQNLCLGFDRIGIDSTGRLSGFVSLEHFRLRTGIQWPKREEALNETPLVQASFGFQAFQLKAAFDYQAFLVADITSLEYMMYNVRESHEGRGDRLVGICDGDAVQVFGTTTSAAQAVALFQAIQKLIQERKDNFETSLKDIEKFMKRKPSAYRSPAQQLSNPPKLPADDTLSKSPISLDTDVVVTLKALNLGVFPSTFSDHQVFKIEALDAYASFAASVEDRRVHSILKLTLGQLRIGLAGVRTVEAPKTLSEISVDDVVQRATGSRGGTILKVPRVAAAMETWQKPDSNHIDYIFKSAFEGKVEVGWNYSRISYIRGMFANHAKSLEQVWGRELPMTAVKITGVPEAVQGEQSEGAQQQQKITAEVTVPQSKYEYTALQPPIIQTPQLRDMGEATPPLEWIGLHRERLPNLTHQIVIVSLLELAGEVEDAYSQILGSS